MTDIRRCLDLYATCACITRNVIAYISSAAWAVVYANKVAIGIKSLPRWHATATAVLVGERKRPREPSRRRRGREVALRNDYTRRYGCCTCDRREISTSTHTLISLLVSATIGNNSAQRETSVGIDSIQCTRRSPSVAGPFHCSRVHR